MKFIEFAVKSENISQIILINIEEIVCFEKINDQTSRILTKNSGSFIVFGKYRHLTNRYFYVLNARKAIIDDDISRPSISIIHNPEKLEIDVTFIDEYQLINMIKALKDELKKNFDQKIQEELKVLIKKHNM